MSSGPISVKKCLSTPSILTAAGQNSVLESQSHIRFLVMGRLLTSQSVIRYQVVVARKEAFFKLCTIILCVQFNPQFNMSVPSLGKQKHPTCHYPVTVLFRTNRISHSQYCLTQKRHLCKFIMFQQKNNLKKSFQNLCFHSNLASNFVNSSFHLFFHNTAC